VADRLAWTNTKTQQPLEGFSYLVLVHRYVTSLPPIVPASPDGVARDARDVGRRVGGDHFPFGPRGLRVHRLRDQLHTPFQEDRSGDFAHDAFKSFEAGA
jgi:hypothetical protein